MTGSLIQRIFFFNGMHVWAQIHGISELYRKTEVVDDLARRIGKVKEVQMNPKPFFEGNYVRIRVRLEIAKPLMRFVSLSVTGIGRKRFAVKYEKIPYYCKQCGLLGHDHEECGDGVWEEKQFQYVEWMIAKRRASQAMPEPRRFVPRAPIRGGWSGRGGGKAQVPRKRSSGDTALDDEEEMKDIAESPLKKVSEIAMEEENTQNNVRKKLDLGAPKNSENAASPTATDRVTVPPPPPEYIPPRERMK
jgi:sporulation protein YlmC with PRC-barrel domain